MDREDIFRVSDHIAAICSRFAINVYQPRSHNDPVKHPNVSDSDVFKSDRKRVLGSDLLILVSQNPSFGAGQELDFAYSALVPILIVSRDSERVSRMVTGIPSLKIHIKYGGLLDLEDSLRRCLPQLRPVLANRRASLPERDANIVGERIRLLREEQQLTRQQVAERLPYLTVETLKQLEEGTDLEANHTLFHLRQIAAVLKTTVSDLVEPDLKGRVLAALQDWLTNSAHRNAARGYHISERDRRILLKTTLLRLLESLEHEQTY